MDTFTDISIERASLEDVDGIMSLAEVNSPDRGGELTGTLVRQAVVGTIPMLPSIVARHNGTIVGFLLTWEKGFSKHPCVLAMLDAWPGSEDAYVYGPICVDNSARGRGIAQQMFRKLCELLPKREGILFIKSGNGASLRAHLKMGMTMTTDFMYEGGRFLVFTYRA